MTPPTSPRAGDDHCPCRMFSPGELSCHTTLPVVLLTAMKLGALGAGTLSWLSSRPLEVTTKTRSSQTIGDEFGHVVLEDAEFLHHVERPDDVGVGRSLAPLVLHRTVVLPVGESFRIEADQLGPIVDEVEALAVDRRRRADALLRPVVLHPRLQLVGHGLPEKRAVGLAEAHQHALVAGDLRVPRFVVVRAHEDLAVGHDGVAVGGRSERRLPLDVRAGLDVPRRGKVRHGRHHVASRRAAPHRPVLLAPAAVSCDRTMSATTPAARVDVDNGRR